MNNCLTTLQNKNTIHWVLSNKRKENIKLMVIPVTPTPIMITPVYVASLPASLTGKQKHNNVFHIVHVYDSRMRKRQIAAILLMQCKVPIIKNERIKK